MQFNPVALVNKTKYLDAILARKDLLERVLSVFSEGAPAKYEIVPRPWEPGGGSTLFKVWFQGEGHFLKVKHLSVTVESRLEGEGGFSSVASLRNEYEYLRRFRPLSVNCPQAFRYAEEDGFGFLLLEPLTPMAEAAKDLSATELLEAFEQIEAFAQLIFAQGVVHTDIHELNLMFRGKTPVLIDFEEARSIVQGGEFANSLDCVGENRWGNVGEMPSGPGRLAGLTCLARLRGVFKGRLKALVPALLKEANFDSSCPFLNALDHGTDTRIYQSINLDGIRVAGQRPLSDPRIPHLLDLIGRHFKRPIIHLDVGSNLGRFNLELSRSERVARSFGVEAFGRYVELARVLAFIEGNANVQYFCAECGKDSLTDLLAGQKIDCVTIYSVYHHIRNKAAFLEDLRRLDPEIILLEMPVQPECYDGRTWQEEMDRICACLGRHKWELMALSTDYQRPILRVSKASVLSNPASAVPSERSNDSRGSPNPLVSVILPAYNHRQFLPAAIESVLAQTFPDFELIVVNDGSTDGTREYLDTLKDPRIRVIHQENQRLPRALNAGFKAARGELLTWVSADNYCAPVFLEAMVAALKAQPEAGVAIAAFAWIDAGGNIQSLCRDQDLSLPSLLTANPGIAAFLYRRGCQQAVGEYDPSLEGAEDWDMWMRLMERFPVVYVPEILYYFRVHQETMTRRIPGRVRESAVQALQNALNRCHPETDLNLLYPAIASCSDRNAAEAEARFDFGLRMLHSPFAPTGLAASLFRASFEKAHKMESLFNELIALIKARHWKEAAECLPRLQTSSQPQIRQALSRLEESIRLQNAEVIQGQFVFTLTAQTSELLARTRSGRRVYSLTREGWDIRRPAAGDNQSRPPSRPAISAPAGDSQAESLLARAGECFAHGDLPQAEQWLVRALESQPDNLDILESLGSVLFQQGNYAAASERFAQACGIDVKRVSAIVKLAMSELKQDHTEVFETTIGHALEIDPRNLEALRLLALLSLQSKAHADAARFYQRILAIKPDDVDSLLALGNCFYALGDRDTARLSFQEALKHQPDNVIARENLAVLDGNPTAPPTPPPESGNPPVTVPADAHLDDLLQRAQSAYTSGDLDTARNLLRQAAEISPYSPLVLESQGTLAYLAGDAASALDAFQRAQIWRPDQPDLLVRLAMAAVKLDRSELFECALGRALQLDPEHREGLRLLADLNLQQKNYAPAARGFHALLQKDPRSVDLLLSLGFCFFHTGDLESAAMIFEQVLGIDPANETARENLAVIRRRPSPDSPVAATSPDPLPSPLPAASADRPQLRVTYLISSILGVTGGNQTLLQQVNALTERGHQVTIVTGTPKPSWFAIKARVIQVPPGQAMAPSVPPSDVVISTYFTNTQELMSVTAPVKVYYAQGDQYVFEDDTLRGAESAQTRYMRALSKASYLGAGIHFVANSHNLARAVEAKYGRRAEAILPVCVDQTVFRPDSSRPPGPPWRILIVGPDYRGTAAEPLLFKGILDIRKALELLSERRQDFTVARMSGTGPDIFRDFPCEFHVAPADAKKTELYGKSHILIYASHYDSCPRPPMEAMGAGVAVVCTATSGAREYCRDLENCLLVPVQSPAAIAGAVERLMTDSALRDRLVQGGLATAGEYPREREWNELEELFYRFQTETEMSSAFSSPASPRTRETDPGWLPSEMPTPPVTMELPPTGYVGRLKTGYELLGKNDWLGAWKFGLQALQLRSFHPEAYVMLGQAAQSAGHIELARQCGRRALGLTPQYDLAHDFLAGLPPKGKKRKLNWPALPPDRLGTAPTLSVCVIAKDEERFIGQCLQSIRPIAHQIVLLDTGSTDRTIEIARGLGAEIHSYQWNDNFSDARNAALEHARGDWVLCLDADEEILPEEHAKLLEVMKNSEVLGCRVPLVNCGVNEFGGSYVPRLFRNAPGLFFVGRVHEQVFPSVLVRAAEWKMKTMVGGGQIRHHGYASDVMTSKNKIERNLVLLRQAVLELPDEPHLMMNLGLELSRSGKAEEGLEKYAEAFRMMNEQDHTAWVPELREGLLTQYSTYLLAAKRIDQAIEVLHSALAVQGD